MRFPFTGVIPVHKPSGVSSRRVVDAVARAMGMRAVGHAGTLDPLATGVVIVCIGHATKLVDYVHELPKHYSATFLLGRSSPSDDLETQIEEEESPIQPTHAAIESAADGFRGQILQRPCDYSAVHVDGRRAYRLARAGRPIAMDSKPVHIERLVITGYRWPQLRMEIVCSSGTFVRAIGRDLALALGTRAVMESLVRTAIGPFSIERCAALSQIEAGDRDLISAQALLLPASVAVAHLPQVSLDSETLICAARGGLVPQPNASGHSLAAMDPNGTLVGILKRHGSGNFRLRPNFLGL